MVCFLDFLIAVLLFYVFEFVLLFYICFPYVGEKPYGTGHVGGAQFTTISGQVSLGHAPPTVRLFNKAALTNFSLLTDK